MAPSSPANPEICEYLFKTPFIFLQLVLKFDILVGGIPRMHLRIPAYFKFSQFRVKSDHGFVAFKCS